MPPVDAAGAVHSVWVKTLTSYKKNLSRRDLLVVQEITSPTDVATHIERLEARTHAGKGGAVADRVHAISSRLTQFSSIVDVMTSSNAEASLIWGSLKLLLSIVHRSAEEYGKICKSILAVSSSFPCIELVAETFNHSELVCSHVVEFYTCVLDFWSKALRFYKRRRVFNIFRAWHDFDSEFGELDRDMVRHGNAIEKAAAAVHMGESRVARLEQKAINRELTKANRPAIASNRHPDIVSWLAPSNHEASYFADDYKSAWDSRHPGTCTWILERPEFVEWMDSGPNDTITRMLWLTGIPGAGKTVLSSFVINRCTEFAEKTLSPHILYFFFKSTDSDKNSVLSVTRSLVYQLYSLLPSDLRTDIVSSRDDSGKEKALSDHRLWDLFEKHATNLATLIVILDALDECNNVDLLLRRMIRFMQRSHAKIFLVSRREGNIAIALESYPRVVISHEDINSDICSYVTAEIEEIPRFQGKSVQKRMINALVAGHEGMFLWAYLMVQELKELGTVRQVDDALKSLPSGLEDMHAAIITRLDSSLHKAHRELAIKILTWVVSAVRPLRLAELQEILRFEIRHGRTACRPSIEDDDLLYSEKDIEMVCGALVISRNETLQLIHLSTKEILTRRPPHLLSEDSRLTFYVDTQRANPEMAVSCVSYMENVLRNFDSITRPNLKIAPRLQLSEESFDSTDLVTKSPLINYASTSWQAHLIDGRISLEHEQFFCQLHKLLAYDLTLLWIELCVALYSDNIWLLERSSNEIMSWADYASVPSESPCHEAIKFFWGWSNAVVSIINGHGGVIEAFPYEIHYLDLRKSFSYECSSGSPFLSMSYCSRRGRDLREQISEIRGLEEQQPAVRVESRKQLQCNMEEISRSDTIGFVVFDSARGIYLSAESRISRNTEELRVQQQATGRRLQPMRCPLNVSGISWDDSGSSPEALDDGSVIAATLSPDRNYLAILYRFNDGFFITSIWTIERDLSFPDIRDRRPWARRLHCFGDLNFSFTSSCIPLTADEEGFFYCPRGQVDPIRGIQTRMPKSLIVTEYSPPSKHVTLAFTGNGQAIIKTVPSTGLSTKISWLKDTVRELFHPKMSASNGASSLASLKATSQTGQCVVCGIEDRAGYFTDFYLLTDQGDEENLSVGPYPYRFTRPYFYFSKDGHFLVGIHMADSPSDLAGVPLTGTWKALIASKWLALASLKPPTTSIGFRQVILERIANASFHE